MTTLASQPATAERLRCGPAQRGDDSAIRRLLRLPMPGRIAIATPHEPDHRQAMRIAGDLIHEVVVRDTQRDDAVIGYGYRAVQDLMVNGSSSRVGYLGGLRCDTPLRTAIKVLGQCFAVLDKTRTSDQAPYDLTSIMADNTVVRRGLEKGLPGLPTYIPVGRITTLTLRTERAGHLSKAGNTAIIDTTTAQEIYTNYNTRFHGRPTSFPASDFARPTPPTVGSVTHLAHGNHTNPTGCLTLWDQRAARQLVVTGYALSIQRARAAINLGLTLAGKPTLPRPGSRLEMAYASHAAFNLDDADTAIALLNAACLLAASRGIPLLSFGLPANTPLLKLLMKRYRPWITQSVIYAVTKTPDTIDLDDRPVWMEIATL